MSLTCFKAYDIRGRLGIDLDTRIAYRIGRGFGRALDGKRMVLGRDCRASSEELAQSVAQALQDEGVEVLDLGLSGTEEMYFATSHFETDGGICVTASHNPMDWNGMKMVRAGSAPLDAETGLCSIRAFAEANDFGPARSGSHRDISAEARSAYVSRVLSFIDVTTLQPLHILVNTGNGAAGPTFDAIAAELAARGAPLRFARMHHTPDGAFPNGIPNCPKTSPQRPKPCAWRGPILVWPGTVISTAAFSSTMRAASFPANMWSGSWQKCFLSKNQAQGSSMIHA
jgi:phosphomannomutase